MRTVRGLAFLVGESCSHSSVLTSCSHALLVLFPLVLVRGSSLGVDRPVRTRATGARTLRASQWTAFGPRRDSLHSRPGAGRKGAPLDLQKTAELTCIKMRPSTHVPLEGGTRSPVLGGRGPTRSALGGALASWTRRTGRGAGTRRTGKAGGAVGALALLRCADLRTAVARSATSRWGQRAGLRWSLESRSRRGPAGRRVESRSRTSRTVSRDVSRNRLANSRSAAFVAGSSRFRVEPRQWTVGATELRLFRSGRSGSCIRALATQ